MPRILVRAPAPDIKLDILNGAAFRRGHRRAVKPSFAQNDTLTIDADDYERRRLESL